MDRRAFLAALAATGLSSKLTGATPPGRFVTSDTGTLKRVLIHHPGPESRKLPPDGEEENAKALTPYCMSDRGIHQHRSFCDLLTHQGAEALALRELLDDAIHRCSERQMFQAWVQQMFPTLAGREDAITGSVLIGAEDEFVFRRDEDDQILPLTPPLKSLFFTRDIAVMTPRGAVLANLVNSERTLEPVLLRFAFEWASSLARYPVAFDACKEGVGLQGGDLLVEDDNTLLLGVGHLSEESTAKRLATTLDMDVVTVQLPSSRLPSHPNEACGNSLCTTVLHLDSVFGFVGDRKAIAPPYLFESKYSGRNDEKRLAFGIGRALGKPPNAFRGLRGLGFVKRYRAKSGEVDPALSGMKLVDYLRGKGYEVIYVGGNPPPAINVEYLGERVLPELRSQGANVVACGPGRVIAYEENKESIRALKAAGVDVLTFPGTDLVTWHGGPHCMSLPLERLTNG